MRGISEVRSAAFIGVMLFARDGTLRRLFRASPHPSRIARKLQVIFAHSFVFGRIMFFSASHLRLHLLCSGAGTPRQCLTRGLAGLSAYQLLAHSARCWHDARLLAERGRAGCSTRKLGPWKLFWRALMRVSATLILPPRQRKEPTRGRRL